jgi:hypothetical protein
MKDMKARHAIALPLIALAVSWSIFMIAVYTELFVTPVYDDSGTWIGEEPAIQAAPYLFFLAVAVFAAAAVVAQRIAIRQRIAEGADERLPRSAHRFATLSIVIALGVGAVQGISVFLEGFNTYGPRSDDLGLRLATTYLPIILYTSLVVAVLLIGFVFRKDSLPKSDDKALLVEDTTHADKPDAQRSLGAAYAVPIIAVAIALIFGLIVFDVTGTNLEVWVWVIIQVMIGAGIVAGTIFGEKAVAGGPAGSSSRSRITRGARGLNFVLSIVFGAVVSLMGFGYGASAIDSLRISPSFYVEILAAPGATLSNVELAASGWDLEEDSTVSVMLEQPARSLLSGDAGHRGDFYQTAPMPQDLEAGDYTLIGSATSADGRPLSRELEFTLSDNGEVDWDYYRNDQFKYEMEDSRILEPGLPWFLNDLLPALVLILLAQTGVFLSLTERNKRRHTSP